MDITKLKRDDRVLKRVLFHKDDKIHTKEDITVLFPERYMTIGLAEISRFVSLYGAIIVIDSKGSYGVLLFPSTIRFTPNAIQDEKINDKPYKALVFKKDTAITYDDMTIPLTEYIYDIYDDWLIKSNNIPFYMGYEDIIKLFIKSHELTGSSVGKSLMDIALPLSIIARSESNEYLRTAHSRAEIVKMRDVRYVGLNDYDKGFKNVASLISNGAYLDKGINAALALSKDAEVTDLGVILSK